MLDTSLCCFDQLHLLEIYRATIYIVYKYIQALDKEILELQDI